jgi:hypothetical protein
VGPSQAGVEFSFAILPESSAFFQPREGSLDHPQLGRDGKDMGFAAFGDLHGCAEFVVDRVGDGLPTQPASTSTLMTCCRLSAQRSNAARAPLRSVTSAVVTVMACGSPRLSTALWRLMPETFLHGSYPSARRWRCSSRSARQRSRSWSWSCISVWRGPRLTFLSPFEDAYAVTELAPCREV